METIYSMLVFCLVALLGITGIALALVKQSKWVDRFNLSFLIFWLTGCFVVGQPGVEDVTKLAFVVTLVVWCLSCLAMRRTSRKFRIGLGIVAILSLFFNMSNVSRVIVGTQDDWRAAYVLSNPDSLNKMDKEAANHVVLQAFMIANRLPNDAPERVRIESIALSYYQQSPVPTQDAQNHP